MNPKNSGFTECPFTVEEPAVNIFSVKITCLAISLVCWFSVLVAQTPAPPSATPSPPPSAAPKRSAADLEKLVAPIALYPDPLLATLLPASVYPLEIVQAARFVANTNNLATLDAQPWDENVKAVARVPALIQKMNEEISWTIELGEAFLAQDKDVMDTIQALRAKAQKAGTLQTSPQQVVVVTNMVVEKTVEQKVVVVTNTIVQIQPASSEVVYVPTYNPYTVYYPPPAYVYNPYAPLVTFAAGVAVGAIIANNCDWYHGGCYHGNNNININNNVNINRGNNSGNINGGNRPGNSQKWQPDQGRLGRSGSSFTAASARSAEARGWGSGGRSSAAGNTGGRPSTGIPGSAGARPSTGMPGSRPSTGAGGSASTRPSAGTASASRPSASHSLSQSRPSSSGSAFNNGSSGAATRDYSNRGSSSRNFGSGGGGRGGGGGGRGGGGRGRR